MEGYGSSAVGKFNYLGHTERHNISFERSGDQRAFHRELAAGGGALRPLNSGVGLLH